jgi:glycine hydroxymethyltransferase
MDLVPFPSLQTWFDKRYAISLEIFRSKLFEDSAVRESIAFEMMRQTGAINLIASESMADPAVMAASASLSYVQTVEGRSGHRWYPCVEGIDALETETEARAKALFNFPEANVQPHSATQANQAVYLAVVPPGSTILSPAFTSGGHLSHGVRASLAGRIYKIVTYGARSFSDEISIEDLERRIQDTRPQLIVAGCSAYPREIPYDLICRLGEHYGVPVLADISHTAGFVAAKIHSSVATADFCTMSLHKTMCGPRGGIILMQEKHKPRVDEAVFPGLQGAVLPSLIAAKAVCLRQASSKSFEEIQHRIIANAKAMAQAFLDCGIALYTGGTDTQLLVIRANPSADANQDVRRLLQLGVLTNANYVVGDKPGTTKMTGIRLGTTWITQLGLQPQHAAALARTISKCMKARDPEYALLRRELNRLLEEVVDLSESGLNGQPHLAIP